LHLFDIAGLGFDGGSFCCGLGTCGFSRLGLAFGLQSGDGGTAGFGFLFGAALCLPGCIFFFRRPDQSGSFGGLLGTQLLGGAVGSELLGLSPLGGHAAQLRFPLHTHYGSGSQFGRSAGAGLRCGQGALFHRDAFAQRGFRETLSLHLFRTASFGLGQGTFSFQDRNFLFGVEPGGGSAASLCGLPGTAACCLRRLMFCGHTDKNGSFGGLLGTQLLGSAVGSELLGLGPLGGHAA